MSKTITAIYHSRDAALDAAERLMLAGYSRSDISMILTESTRGREFAIEEESKAPEGATIGAVTGGVLGAVAAGLVATGVVLVPGVALVAAGPVVAALAGAGAGGAAGGFVGGLIGMGIPEHEAKLYSEQIEKGGILVGVYAHDDRKDAVREILEASGGERIHG